MDAPRPPDLLLRPWAESDVEALRAAIDEEVAHLRPWLSWTLEEPATPERTGERLARWIEQFRSGEGYRWAIAPLDDPTHVLGGANLNRRLGPDEHDVGYWVRKSATRRGIASAAVARLVVHAFEDPDVWRLVARSDRKNEVSATFARTLGFEPAGETVDEYPDGTPRPIRCFELRRERWVDPLASRLRGLAERVRLGLE